MKTIKINRADLPKTETPFLNYCRQLIKDGEDPSTRLEVYGIYEPWDIEISSIGEGAKLTVLENESRGPEFRQYVPFPAKLKK